MEEKEIKKSDSLKKDKESVVSIAWIVTAILAVVIIVVSVILATKGSFSVGNHSLSMNNFKVMSAKEAQDKVTKYINEDLLQGQAVATVSDFKLEKGTYKMKVTFNGKEIESYLSLDGTLFFPEVYDMNESLTGDTNTNTNSASATVPKTEKATAYLFTMAFCPYGNQAEVAMNPVIDLLKDKATIEPHYIVSKTDTGYESLHGAQELTQDVRELCVNKYSPDKYWDFVDKVNANCTAQNADTCWEEQAKAAGVDTAKITTCQKDEANALLDAEIALTDKYSVTGSPSLVINDVVSSAARTADGYKTAVCSGFNTAPAECSQALSTTVDTNTSSGSCN